MELTKEQIEHINKEAPMDWQTNEQGVFTEPSGIPNDVKEPVIYMRWETGVMETRYKTEIIREKDKYYETRRN